MKRLIRRETARRDEVLAVLHDAVSFRVVAPAPGGGWEVKGEVKWGEVAQVFAYKRDLVTRDLLSLSVLPEGRAGLDLNEEMGGWGDLVTKLPEYLPGCLPLAEWFGEVAFPAFAMNPTRIYRKHLPTDSQAVGS